MKIIKSGKKYRLFSEGGGSKINFEIPKNKNKIKESENFEF